MSIRNQNQQNRNHKHVWRKELSKFVIETGRSVFVFKKVPLQKCRICKEIFVPENVLRFCLDYIACINKNPSPAVKGRIYFNVAFSELEKNSDNL